ncbi:MAG: hypothetical protein V7L04_14115 [Nostoc sp.]|uniref:hypothetical protein n=1 Tax=Nostoc sp. TaxID=1180 RepID=UPI002FFCAF02
MSQKIIIPSLNYDQQSMPTNPSIGQVWRERDSSNNVIETWFWNGTVWLSLQIFSLNSNISDLYIPLITHNSTQILITKFIVLSISSLSGDNDASNFYTYSLRTVPLNGLSETIISSLTSQALVDGQRLVLSTAVNNVYSSTAVSSLIVRTIATGSPKEVPSQGSLLILFRLVR